MFIIWSIISLFLTAVSTFSSSPSSGEYVAAILQVPLVIVDSIYYGKLVCAPLNIIMYNVFGKGGPNLYGEVQF